MVPKVCVRAVAVAALVSVLSATAVAQTCPPATPPVGQCPANPVPSVHGVWQEFNGDPIICWGGVYEAVHMILLKTGKVLCISNVEVNWIIDPDDPETIITLQDSPGDTVFCSGHAQLADGRVLFAGGGGSYTDSHDQTVIFDPDDESWVELPDDPIPTGQRWYPTCTTINKGKVLVLGGGYDDAFGNSDIPAVFDISQPAGQRYTELVDAERHWPWYPFTFQLPSSKILVAGSHFWGLGGSPYPVVTATLDTVLEEWSADIADPECGPPISACDDIKGSSAVMFRPGKVLKGGGATSGNGFGDCIIPDVTDRIQAINMAVAAPVWTDKSSMNHARSFFYLIAMPDGQVMAVGGCHDSDPILVPEMYDVTADTWQDLACMDVRRGHHASAILLPDARVMVAGGDDSSGSHYDAQIYQPPYLFQPGTRPVIASAPAEINYNTLFRVTVGSSKAQDITDVSLLRLGGATHSYDFDQRFMWLNFVPDPQDPTNKLKISAPPHGFVAPPGYYMLFILDDGVPSIAEMVKVAPAP